MVMSRLLASFTLLCLLLVGTYFHDATSLQSEHAISRRSMMGGTAGILTASAINNLLLGHQGAQAADLSFETSKSTGLQYADAKLGTGQPLKAGNSATIDYVLSTTGARYGSKIYSTQDKDMPYRWKLGDGSTIAGIEKAILGDVDLPAMLPGGIRRVIIPQNLGYGKLATNSKALCVQDGQPGPIPPPNAAFEEYQRFKNIYCNSERQYQPDIVMDIKLYGSRR